MIQSGLILYILSSRSFTFVDVYLLLGASCLKYLTNNAEENISVIPSLTNDRQCLPNAITGY